MTTLPRVATNINVFCKKCDTDRYFKVITHTSDTSAKLKCEVCGCSRTYNLAEESKAYVPKGKTARAPRAPKETAAAKASKSQAVWLTMKEEYKGPQAVDYSISNKFADQTSLNHPTFGLGFVTKSLPSKIEVVFSDGVKELMHCKK